MRSSFHSTIIYLFVIYLSELEIRYRTLHVFVLLVYTIGAETSSKAGSCKKSNSHQFNNDLTKLRIKLTIPTRDLYCIIQSLDNSSKRYHLAQTTKFDDKNIHIDIVFSST